AEGLRRVGVQIEERPDGAVIQGGRISAGEINSGGDHRVAMSFAVAAIAADGPLTILDTANVATSYPNFVEHARTAGMRIECE
ncbi:MAG: bifunctional prephenate dehydrogenase/3-phosphoshikimate 1-carboxyvinyltransferase, partial [Gammaproteobacteria bacterium]|nr:bifunctional prephenate dehydrogenase/3-phosphoshikimate 1-carboxyvinyltransferase [Gammaproteobacteria bacterium]